MRQTGRRGRFVHKPRESSPPDLEETRAETVPRCESLRVSEWNETRGAASFLPNQVAPTASCRFTFKIDKPMSKELKVKVRRRRQ